MSIYMVTWKTIETNGEHIESSFFTDSKEVETIEEAVEWRKEWFDFIKQHNPKIKGRDVIFTGVFKL